MIPACIHPTTDPPPTDLAVWTCGEKIPDTHLSAALENGFYRRDVAIYTGPYKRAIQRVQKCIVDCYFHPQYTSFIVNGVLLAKIEGKWEDIALVNMEGDYVPAQHLRTKSLFD